MSSKAQNILIGLLVGLLIVLGGWYVFSRKQAALGAPKDLHYTAVKELGRDHITDISSIPYTSNPPTSGPHFAIWAKRGLYPQLISDGHFIHSLEHGYIVISYNCGTLIPSATTITYAKGAPLTKLTMPLSGDMAGLVTPDNMPKKEVDLPPSFSSASCKALVKQLSTFLDDKDYARIIVTPRPGMPTKIALAAWGKLDRMDSLDMNRIHDFIAAFHNKGPEQTTE